MYFKGLRQCKRIEFVYKKRKFLKKKKLKKIYQKLKNFF